MIIVGLNPVVRTIASSIFPFYLKVKNIVTIRPTSFSPTKKGTTVSSCAFKLSGGTAGIEFVV